MDFYRPISLVSQFQDRPPHHHHPRALFHPIPRTLENSADSDFRVGGEFSARAPPLGSNAGSGFGCRSSTVVARFGSCPSSSPLLKIDRQGRLPHAQPSNEASVVSATQCGVRLDDVNRLSGNGVTCQSGSRKLLWVSGISSRLQYRRTRVFVKTFWGLKVSRGRRFAIVEAHMPGSRVSGPRQSVRVNLAATQSDTEADASVEDSENEGPFRRGEKNDGFRRRQMEDRRGIESDSEMLRLIEGSKDFYPMVRTYRNDLCTLELCGSAKRSQVLAAMASDRSYAAATNLLMGRRLTVLQTVLPGSSGNHSTVSTKLFAPSSLVVERAKSFTLPNGVASRDFVHRLFEAVQMQNFSKFYVEFHAPGTRRDMSALEMEEMAQTTCTLESSNKSALDEFAKAISLYAIACIKENAGGSTSAVPLWKFWQKDQWVPSSRAPIRICTLSDQEISTQVSESIHLAETAEFEDRRADHSWWPAPVSSMALIRRHLDHSLEPWAQEYMPIHKLQIDLSVLDVQVTGGCPISEQVQELLLTHAQLVDLAGALDLYYEDCFTLSDKKLHTGALLDFHCVSRSKMSRFLETATLASVLAGAAIFVWLVAARFRRSEISPGMGIDKLAPNSVVLVDSAAASNSLQTGVKDKPVLLVNEEIPAKEMEALCEMVVAKVMKAFQWPGQIQSSVEKGAWMGRVYTDECSAPDSEKCRIEAPLEDTNLNDSDVEVTGNKSIIPGTKLEDEGQEYSASDLLKVGEGLKTAEEGTSQVSVEETRSKVQRRTVRGKEEMLVYQVVLSRDGDVLGFMPLNQAAVTFWARMPFAEFLHQGQKLAPGFLEWPLKYKEPPIDAVVVELSLLDDRVSPFIHAKPFPI